MIICIILQIFVIMNVYLCVNDNIINGKTFNETLKDLFIEYPDLVDEFIDFRNIKMNWYYYDFQDFLHPSGIRGDPYHVRRCIFNHVINSRKHHSIECQGDLNSIKSINRDVG